MVHLYDLIIQFQQSLTWIIRGNYVTFASVLRSINDCVGYTPEAS